MGKYILIYLFTFLLWLGIIFALTNHFIALWIDGGVIILVFVIIPLLFYINLK